MTSKSLCIAGVLMLVMSQSATAKVIKLGTVSRSTLATACARAHGGSFERDDGGHYGCHGGNATIICNSDTICHASVGDMVPMTGNSLHRLLGLTAPGGGVAIRPADHRVRAANNPASYSSFKPAAP